MKIRQNSEKREPQTAPFDSIYLAKYIVQKCISDGVCIDNLRLQQVLYYAYVKYQELGNVLFFDEIKWRMYGPYLEKVYDYYCGFGVMKITMDFGDVDISDEDKRISIQLLKQNGV